MKVIKRDGSIVDYDRSKISTAIQKANDEVPEEDRLSQDRIDAIIDRIEELKRPRILVEDIQDLVEQGLVAENKFHLAKTYIIYRYNRALVRKANTTDESILSLLRNENKELAEENSNKNTMIAATQRDYIAGEVSRDLTRRILLPEYISKAHDEGAIHFHDADYFVQPIFNCCLINIGDMLDNGTVMNGKLIESPKSFQVACTVTTQIIACVASNQYGGQSVDMSHLGKYLRRSREKFRKHIFYECAGQVDEATLEEYVAHLYREDSLLNLMYGADGEQPVGEEEILTYARENLYYGVCVYLPLTGEEETQIQESAREEALGAARRIQQAAADTDSLRSAAREELPQVLELTGRSWTEDDLDSYVYANLYTPDNWAANLSEGALEVLKGTAYGACSVLENESSITVFLRLNPEEEYTAEDLRPYVTRSMKQSELDGALALRGAELPHQLDEKAIDALWK